MDFPYVLPPGISSEYNTSPSVSTSSSVTGSSAGFLNITWTNGSSSCLVIKGLKFLKTWLFFSRSLFGLADW